MEIRGIRASFEVWKPLKERGSRGKRKQLPEPLFCFYRRKAGDMPIPNEEKGQFKPGTSGNPNGRPRKLPRIDDLLSEVLGEDENDSAAKAILEALLKKAKAGDTKAAEILLDRAYGKPKQTIDQKNTIEDERIDLSKLTTEELDQLEALQRKGREGKEKV